MKMNRLRWFTNLLFVWKNALDNKKRYYVLYIKRETHQGILCEEGLTSLLQQSDWGKESRTMDSYDVVVIGGGPGGYVAAARAAHLGMKTVLVEKEALGGTCLNWGCIPTKSLLQNAEVIHLLSRGRAFGFSFDNLVVDYALAHKRSRQVVMRQNRRIKALMKSTGVTICEGTARFMDAETLRLTPSNISLHGENIIIATGATGRELPGCPFDGERIINFRNALELTELPDSALIVGAGPIGMEFATLWNRYGRRVTVVELMAHALPFEDEAISVEAEKQFKRNGITIKTKTLVERA
jgi:dihydrolipoamide dehydrogenase